MSRSTRKPWVTDSYGKNRRPKLKRIHERRYRRNIRQDVKQWSNKHYLYDSIFPGCAYCECLDEFWDNDAEALFWRACLSFELEPSYPPPQRCRPDRFNGGFRHYCDNPEFCRK